MRHLSFVLLIVTIAVLFSGCSSAPPLIPDEAAYLEQTHAWQQQRLERLKDKDGWLSLAGLYWLDEGISRFGSDPDNDIQFPDKAAPFCGTLELNRGEVTLKVAEGVDIYLGDSLVKELKLIDDQTQNTTRLQQGDLAWYIIKRGELYGIRLRDHKHPRINELDHIPSYPIQTNFVVEATLVPFEEPETITVATPVEGYTEDYVCPGILHFRIKGKKLTLHPFNTGNRYFLVFADETNGLETYGAGRFMYASPDSTGRVILDFNRAYNPPCAFSPYATCPLPPRENILPVAIEAGEKAVHLQ